jgi:hypothetical protein
MSNEKPPQSSVEQGEQSKQEFRSFVQGAKSEENLFYLDKELTLEELRERFQQFNQLLERFEKASFGEREEIEKSDLFSQIPTITADAQSYLTELRSDPNTEITAGAENENYIYTEGEQKKVIKVSKERHDYDVASVIKLMRNMYALQLFEKECPAFMSLQEGNIDIKVMFENIVVYKDAEGKYKRIIEQPFADGEPIKKKMANQEEEPELQAAWKKFLEQIGLLQATAEVVLDITDSTQGAKPSRGDVSQTENVFIDENEGVYQFQIIDIDVFDDPLMDTKKEKGTQHKFYASEHVRKRGLAGIVPAIKVFVTNLAREEYVKKLQDVFTKKEMDK